MRLFENIVKPKNGRKIEKIKKVNIFLLYTTDTHRTAQRKRVIYELSQIVLRKISALVLFSAPQQSISPLYQFIRATGTTSYKSQTKICYRISRFSFHLPFLRSFPMLSTLWMIYYNQTFCYNSYPNVHMLTSCVLSNFNFIDHFIHSKTFLSNK